MVMGTPSRLKVACEGAPAAPDNLLGGMSIIFTL